VPLPLEGIRIIDLSWIIAGPLATRFLAHFGADVIKVESRSRMDVGRANRTPLYGDLPGDANSNPDTGGYFQDVNAGKRSCTLDLTTEGGRELLRRLVRVSDAIICNLAGDQLVRWGVGYEQACELNPGIIVVNVPAMESSGPRTGWRGFGDTFAGVGGIKAVSGHPSDPPLPFGHQYPDFSANAFHAATALVAAIHHRDRTGEGQFIEISQYESTAAISGATVLEYTANGELPPKPGNRDPMAAPHNIYRCEGDDSWCAIAVEDGSQWAALIAFDGLEALRDERFGTLRGRQQHEDEIDAVIERWTVRWDRQQLATALQERGVPAGPFQNIEEIVEIDPTLSDQHFARLPHPVGRDFLVHRNPIRMMGGPVPPWLGPLIGADTFEVLSEVVGLSGDEIAEYAAKGALE
jgi:crotonobetainyl-CoA:carnitine CoA-transferase CaiB-like acyl-CoA transferase